MEVKNSPVDEPDEKRRKLIVSEKEAVDTNISSFIKYDGAHFRKLIKGDNPLGGVRQLLAVIRNTSNDILSDFLNSGGSALDVVLVLDKLESNTFFHNYQPVFSVLSLIINRVRDEYPRLMSSTEDACRRLLHNHTAVLHSMLASSSSQVNKKTVLEMLTAMVMLSVQLAREVLSLSLREATMNELAKHPMNSEPYSVRAHFLRYVLSYFYHDSIHLTKQLIENRNLLQCIILAGLTNDEAPLIKIFFSTLKEKIVENITIMKTTKRKIFNTKVMMKLLEAYTWTGPRLQKKSGKKGDGPKVWSKVREEDKEEVVGYLHQLMTVLCTNHKLGVAFVDPTVGLDEKNYNDLVFSVIRLMNPYWNVSLVRELAVEIVTACPDLVAPTFKHLGVQGSFQPDVSLSFVHTCQFAKQVIESLVPGRSLTKSGSPDQLTHLTTRVVFNMNVLSSVRAGLASIHPTLRLLAISLLNSAFLALSRFTHFVKTHFSSTPKNFIEYNQSLSDHITKNIAMEQELMVAWSLGVGGDQSGLPVPTETEYYLPLLELLLSYSQVFPLYLPAAFITKLQHTTLDTIDIHTAALFRVRLIKVALMFRSIQPSQPEFGEMVETLVPLLSSQDEAKSVLKSLLMKTGYFEGVESEVDIWVTNLTLFPTCESHLPLLLATLSEAVSKPKRCIKMLEEFSNPSDVSEADEFDWNELIEVSKNPSAALTPWEKMLPSSRISILVPALIRVLNNNIVDSPCSCKFITHLLGDITYSQVELHTYYQMLESCASPLVEPVKEYVSKWINIEESSDILSNQPFKKHSSEYRMLKMLSSHNFSVDEPLKPLGEVEPETLSVLLRLVVFHAVRGRGSHSPPITQELLTRLAGPDMQLSALQEVLLHPLVLLHFTPLQPPSPHNLTPLILALVDLVYIQHHKLLNPYRKRFLDQLQKAIKKGKKVKSSNLQDIFTKLVTGKEEVSALLSTIVESQPELDEWTDVAGSLLQSASSLKCLLPGEVITVLSRHTSLHTLLVDYLTVFPHLIDCLHLDHLTSSQEQLSQLCCLVLKFDSDGSVQRRLLKNNKRQLEVIFPALAAAGRLADSSLVRHCGHLVPRLIDCLQSDPIPTWLTENSGAIGAFLADSSDDKCLEVYNCLDSQLTWSSAHLDIAKHVYVKLGHVVNFVVKTLDMLVPLTAPPTLARAESVCASLRDVVDPEAKDQDWEPIRSCEVWSRWVRLALKLGETPDTQASFLLSTLTRLCAAVYHDDRSKAANLTEMVFSHSQFLAVVLAKPSPTKDALMELILTLLQLDASVMVSSHIPIFLSAYSASLSTCDQLILRLLQLYEKEGVSIAEWKPLLWGESAASFYSVRSQVTPGLWTRQSFTQLLDLFDEQRVNTTIAQFPVDRDLKPKDSVKEQADVYDPAFYLPMLVSMFAPSEIVFTYKTCQSGCLSLVLSALASYHENVRIVAYVALQRFHCHLESHTNSQDTLWLHFLDALRLGLNAAEGEVPRINSVVAVFLARTALVLTNPSHPLYLPLSQFVLAKPRFHLETVPELLPLFNSADVQLHNTHQEWMLSVLRDGMRDSEDFLVCLKSMVFKIILEFYSSTLASEKSKLLILETLLAAVSVRGAGLLLMGCYSLYPWLHSVVRDPSPVLLTPLIALLTAVLHKSSAAVVVPLLIHLASLPQLTEPQLTAVLAALAPHQLTAGAVTRLVDTVDSTLGGAYQLRTMLANGVKYVEPAPTESKDAMGYLKNVVLRLFQNEL
uniref:Nucleolar pre-ribosomal-associated protein 1 C-terminal domain-containing protein n=1 Tax=Graphocephala atropunctata TaxID=36148 RepID=A0A1B6LNS0_9HEMI